VFDSRGMNEHTDSMRMPRTTSADDGVIPKRSWAAQNLPPTAGVRGVAFSGAHLRGATFRNWLKKAVLHSLHDYTELHTMPQEMHELH